MDELNKRFEQNHNLLVQIANSPEGRALLGISQDADYVCRITPNSTHFLKGTDKKGDYIIEAKVTMKAENAEVLIPVLDKIEILQEEYSRRYDTLEAAKFYTGHKRGNFPLIFLTSTAVTANTNNNSMSNQTASGYAATHDAATGSGVGDPDATALYLSNLNNSGSTYTVTRYGFYFDLTGIAATATVTAASLALKTSGDYTNTNSSTAILSAFTPANKDSIAAVDFDQGGGTSFGAGTLTAANTAFSITLNASGITATQSAVGGYMICMLRASGDFNNVSPSGVELQVNICAADNGTPADRPILTVTYTLPSSASQVIVIM